MAKNSSKLPFLSHSDMKVPADDSRDPQFHLDITKKNDDAGRTAKAVKYKC